MVRKDAERLKARELRAQGWAVPAIAVELRVSKSSVSLWVRDVPVLPENVSVPGYERLRPPKPKLLLLHAASLGLQPAVRLRVWRSGEVRRCARCSNTLPLEMFNKLREGHQAWCRACFRAYFRERGDTHRQQSGVARRSRIAAAKEYVAAHLASHPCADCGEPDATVLEFDHVGPKRSNVARLVSDGARTDVIADEIAHCEVVCANCHRMRTAGRSSWLRLDPNWRARVAALSKPQAARLTLAYATLEQSGCVDCGMKELPTFDFDHRRDKVRNVSQMLRDDATFADLAAEIAKCEVRCANCHRRRTTGQHLLPPVGRPKL